jgi:hypothetical protein
MMFIKVAPKNIEYVWPDCARFFSTMPEWKLPQFDAATALAHIKSGGHTLHAAFNANGNICGAYITHEEQYVNGIKSLFVDAFCGDDFNAWSAEFFDAIENFAKESNCNAVEYIGRKGFSKLDPTYQEDGRLYVKMIEGKHV